MEGGGGGGCHTRPEAVSIGCSFSQIFRKCGFNGGKYSKMNVVKDIEEGKN